MIILMAVVAVAIVVVLGLAIRAFRKPPAAETPPPEIETIAPVEPTEDVPLPPAEDVVTEAEAQAALIAAGAASLEKLQQQVQALAADVGIEATADITLQIPPALAGTELPADARELPLQLAATVDFATFLNLLQALEDEFPDLRVSNINMLSGQPVQIEATCVFPGLDPAVMTAYVAAQEVVPPATPEPEVSAVMPLESEVDPTALVQEKPIPIGTIQRSLTITGIMGDDAHRSAIVNDTVVKAGDAFMITVNGRTCALAVVEIKDIPPTVILRYQSETFPLVFEGTESEPGTK
jgi:hypothetical protein